MTQMKAGFPCSGLNTGSSFISEDEGRSESPMETLEKALVPASSGQQASHPLTPREAPRVQCFKMWRGLTVVEN